MPLFMLFSVSFLLVFEALRAKRRGGGEQRERHARALLRTWSRPRDRAAFPCACAYHPLQPFPHFLGPDPSARPTERLARARALPSFSLPRLWLSRPREVQLGFSSLTGIATFLLGRW